MTPQQPPRYAPHRRPPPYSYVTGKFPHPTRDPQGHSFECEPTPVKPPTAESWTGCEEYLYGVDLFNAGYYWEAHEAWEAVWHSLGRRGPLADFCKGLIKLAAAGVKAREGRSSGVTRHAARAEELFEKSRAEFEGANSLLGIDLAELLQHARWLQRNASAVIDTSPAPVVKVLPIVLELGVD